MIDTIKIGSAVSKPGTIQYGRWDAFTHPTGHSEFLPVIIAQGKEPGPCIWLTAGIHGNEHTGPAALYRMLTKELVSQLKGTIVTIPALSPAGLRIQKYVPYHVNKNPNRMWPDGKPKKMHVDPEKQPPTSLEQAYARLFEEIKATANYLIDYHNSYTSSIAFTFRDRVLYRADENEAANRVEAEKMSRVLDEMLKAFGHTIINEYPASKYIDDDLHRSTSGAALLVGKIPSFTVELGTGTMPDLHIVASAIAGTRNVLRWAGMLNGELEPLEKIIVVEPVFQARRSRGYRAEVPCISIPLVRPGDVVKPGDALCELRDIWGRPLDPPFFKAKHAGFVISPAYGIYFNPSDTLMYMAIRDEHPLTGPYPKNYFEIDKENK